MQLRAGAYTGAAPGAAPVAAPGAAPGAAPALAEPLERSRQCCARLQALALDARQPGYGPSAAVAQIHACADLLAARPLDAAVVDDYTRLSIVARHARMQGGSVRDPHFQAVLADVAARLSQEDRLVSLEPLFNISMR